MEHSSSLVPFPLLQNAGTYSPCTMRFREEHHSMSKLTPTEQMWINVFRNSVSSFKKRAAEDSSVTDAATRAEKFAERYLAILEDFEKEPESHGGPPNIVDLCRLRDVILREVGFEDIFKKVKAEENDKAMKLLPAVLKLIDGIEDPAARIEKLVRGVFAGNIFDLGATASAEMFAKGDMTFAKTCEELLPRPWVIDDFDQFKAAFLSKTWKKVVIFCDNSGADVVLGIIPFAREFLGRGSQVVLAVNDLPAINDVTYPEMLEIISQVEQLPEFDEALAMGVDRGQLLVVNSGSDLPVADLSQVSQELAYTADDADLVILEGMGRSIETNLNAKFKCDSLNVGMVKHKEVADFLGGRLYDCVIKFAESGSKSS